MGEPREILNAAFRRALSNLGQSLVADEEMRNRVDYVARNLKNRAGVRLLMACLVAKIHRPELDVRKPYTEIGTPDAFSGRTYDERYIAAFINEHNLPCNSTTAFLTPALRNRNVMLIKDLNLLGKPPQLYESVLNLLDDVANNKVSAEAILAETIRLLITDRNQRQQRIEALVKELKTTEDALPLSSEDIVNLIEKHLSLKGTSRLPVLLVAAAYQAAQEYLREKVLKLQSHNAADRQTGAIGDVEITILGDNQVLTSYEMKSKRVTKDDIDRALQKLANSGSLVNNYIFITTDVIDEEVQKYAISLYHETGGIELVILDCIGFLRHFLHLFHRLRSSFLETYQALILAEPQSAVSQPVKEAFLAMRQTAEAGVEEG
ncbi:restriction endonuclease, SacI family [Limnofasciculus baicalensis]|uniref:Restriction endonuclease, SacI family n=1 Tax=Limnofasciculus baicalensis BBK-W-15 TaxID=2699891 RepID=A0AAE3GYU2_9CYAN|nr:restriction endonuclease, SacI family [Limnofasciculus baicalensis]MCP2731092.1 restriction endonuclease, SacI family [Limnofasciculus baicalensis BBK-W-15]